MEKPPSPSSPKHQRSSSIDNEPKTLNYEQFEKALKGALEVINIHTREEMEKIFVEGLKTVGSAVNPKLNSMAKADEFDDDEADNINEVKKP